MMKNTFYFILKSLFVLLIFQFFPEFLDDEQKRFDEKAKVNFKIYEVINWSRNK